MKNPAKLLWMAFGKGLLCAALALAAVPGIAQEKGLALKGEPINFSELAQRQTNGAPVFRPTHKRLQQEPRRLPVDRGSAATVRRAASVTEINSEPPPETLPIPSPSPSLSFNALPDDGLVAPPDASG